jgi:hypothetical protein
MSYGLMVYAVDFKTLTDVCGQGDESLFHEIWRYFSEDIDRCNEAFDLQSLPGNVSLQAALHHLLLGEPKTLPAYLYGYAFEYVVRFYGKALNNGPFYPCSMEFLMDGMTAEIAESRVNLDLFGLVVGPPIALPTVDDFPMVGSWSPDLVAKTNGAWKKYWEEDPTFQTIWANQSFEMCALCEWIAYAANHQQGLVGFYY